MSDGFDSMYVRPPIGFVVEGAGEHTCYPSLVNRVLGTAGLYTPILNAGGCGKIYRKLGDLLSQIVTLYHPFEIVVTVDLMDAICQDYHSCCMALRLDLDRQSTEWSNTANHDSRLHPLPTRIVSVIQIQKFETWIISDILGLQDAGLVHSETTQFGDVDSMVLDPSGWLQENQTHPGNVKHSKIAKSFISSLDPGRMEKNSRSFSKFAREVRRSYQSWQSACGFD